MYNSNRPNSIIPLTLKRLTAVAAILFGTRISSVVGLVLPPNSPAFDGAQALAATKKAVAFGERPSGSPENVRQRDWILAELKPLGGTVELDTFSGQTPNGPVPMANIIVHFKGVSGKAITVTGHYDTKKIPMMSFVGANDGGSSTGFLIEFARVMAKMKHRDDVLIVFFDGEEAVGNWTASDSCYGSRHLAAKWLADGTLKNVKALINVDMIGDKSLNVMNDENSSASLREMTQKAAAKLGHSQYFEKTPGAIEDDHKPFAEAGVNVLDLIDFAYGPDNGFWHNAKDTMDKLSAHSLQVVGDVVVELVRQLDTPPKPASY
ncbi:MAG TPA: M28 family peptidase [Bryobacteraceae bacterium]|nr:M28 family peptidase [Bryobacteraceae bacterium]